METIHLAKWETRFWAWLIDIILIGALKSGVIGFLGLVWDVEFMSFKDFGVTGIMMFIFAILSDLIVSMHRENMRIMRKILKEKEEL